MSERRTTSSDTIPIPQEVIDRFGEGQKPVVPCPACLCSLCGGSGVVDADKAQHWLVRNAPTKPEL